MLGWLGILLNAFNLTRDSVLKSEAEQGYKHREAHPRYYTHPAVRRRQLLNVDYFQGNPNIARDRKVKEDSDIDPYLLRTVIMEDNPRMRLDVCSDKSYRIYYDYVTHGRNYKEACDFVERSKQLKKLLQCVLFDYNPCFYQRKPENYITVEDAQKDPDAILKIRTLYKTPENGSFFISNPVGCQSRISHILPSYCLGEELTALVRTLVSNKQTIITPDDNFSEMVARAENDLKECGEILTEADHNSLLDWHWYLQHLDVTYKLFRWEHPKEVIDEYVDYARDFKNRPETKYMTLLPEGIKDDAYFLVCQNEEPYRWIASEDMTMYNVLCVEKSIPLSFWKSEYFDYMREQEWPMDFYNWCWTRHSMLNRETIDYSCDDMSKNIDYEAEMFGFYAIRKLAIRKSGSYTFKSIYRKEDYEQYKEKNTGKML